MRFLCLYRPGKPETDGPKCQEEVAGMGKLIEEMSRAGVLLATEGCMSSKHGFRVDLQGDNKFTVTDGPFPETKELIVGFCLMQCKTREEALEWTKRFLTVAGGGQSEVRQIYEFDAG